MLMFHNRGVKYTLEIYCIFIIFGLLSMIFFDTLYYKLFDNNMMINTRLILNDISMVILVYFIPIYYYNKFKSINIIFYINYAIILSLLYTFISVITYNVHQWDFNELYLQKLIFNVLLYINGSLFLTYYLVMFYSFMRKKVITKRLVRYGRENNDWFM